MRPGAVQEMFNDIGLTGCNQLLIHESFEAQAPSVWGNSGLDWASATCHSPPPSAPSPPMRPVAVFGDKTSLVSALNEWCANPTEATYGHISTWDVRAVTDMYQLMVNTPCRSTFDEDINAWDVGKVTNMQVRRRPLWRLGAA